MRDEFPLALVVVFVPFSLVTIGGGTSIVAGLQHQVVDVHGWLNAREFVDSLQYRAPLPDWDSALKR